MENACTLCYDLVLHHNPHPALKKISELKGSELYKCCCCYAYLHKHSEQWEIISGGEFLGTPSNVPGRQDSESNHQTSQPKSEGSFA